MSFGDKETARYRIRLNDRLKKHDYLTNSVNTNLESEKTYYKNRANALHKNSDNVTLRHKDEK